MKGLLDSLVPSQRAHGAQRMVAATILVVQAFVAFFAVLVAHQLDPDDRVLNWVWGLSAAAALVLCSGLLRRRAWPYLLGFVLQIPVLMLGLVVPAMYVIGGAFLVLYVYGVLTFHRLDAEKDEIDRRVLAGEVDVVPHGPDREPTTER
ncbi:DUF4233 domain-containing protein [Brachybacterium sp. DNPG3]